MTNNRWSFYYYKVSRYDTVMLFILVKFFIPINSLINPVKYLTGSHNYVSG